jgi:hypothetical protein
MHWLGLWFFDSILPSFPVQVGSQHRSKAEPAGAVVNGKWVPSKPSADQTTLTGGKVGTVKALVMPSSATCSSPLLVLCFPLQSSTGEPPGPYCRSESGHYAGDCRHHHSCT